jgi:hypothetical protein
MTKGEEKPVPPAICRMIDENLPNAVTYRRRDFEQDAMMRELCHRSDLVLPVAAANLTATAGPADAPPLTVAVISNGATAADLLRDVLPELQAGSRGVQVAASPSDADVVSADRVLLVLTPGVLQPPSLELLLEVIRVDKEAGQDRIVAVYCEEAGWRFGCDEQTQASAEVQACLNDHEAITYRRKDPAGASRHEFPAMAAHLRAKLLGPGGGGGGAAVGVRGGEAAPPLAGVRDRLAAAERRLAAQEARHQAALEAAQQASAQQLAAALACVAELEAGQGAVAEEGVPPGA